MIKAAGDTVVNYAAAERCLVKADRYRTAAAATASAMQRSILLGLEQFWLNEAKIENTR